MKGQVSQGGIPVSYTHLDVYKRQILDGFKSKMARGNDSAPYPGGRRMAGQRLTGAAAQAEAMRALAHSRAGIESSLAPFEPKSTFEVWFSTFRGIEELINLPGELRGEPLLEEIVGLALLEMGAVLQALPSIKTGLEFRFSRLVAQRLMRTLVQPCRLESDRGRRAKVCSLQRLP